MKTLQIAIAEFAVPAPRVGHIEVYSGYGGLPNLGTAIHQRLQAERITSHPGYIPERWITHGFERGGYRVAVSGRMDGFLPGPAPWIEEIKSAFNVEDLRRALDANADHPYKLQLRTYGYLHRLQTGLTPRLSLHLVNARNKNGLDIEIDLDPPGFEAWLERRLDEIVAEQKLFEKLAHRRRQAADGFVFPFPEARPGQRELMQTVESGLANGSRLLLQAPTGLGKTAGVLFPALRQSMRRGQKTVYLTAKNAQHEVAEDAVRRLQEAGVKLRSVTLHAKTKICMKDEPHCDPAYCEFAREHYTKMSRHDVAGVLAKKKRLTADSLRRLARRFEVCPFELQLEAVPRADVVICDYNYVFSPRGSLGRLTHNGFDANKQRPNLVIDEIHNLPARAADYHSAALSSSEISRLCGEIGGAARPAAFDVLDSLRLLLIDLTGEKPHGPRRVELDEGSLSPLLARAQEMLARHLDSGEPLRPADPVLRIHRLVGDFAAAVESVGEESFVTLTPQPGGGGDLRLTCCDASAGLRVAYDHFAGVVGFSATLKPFAYYSRLLGLDDTGNDVNDTNDKKLITAEFASPFPRRNRKILVIPQVSTRMRDRAANLAKIKEVIERILAIKPGNYFVFFPSFDFMRMVLDKVELPDFRVLAQSREMGREAVNSYLEQLRDGAPTVIFAVQGGVFSEGVDYPGAMLIGAIVVGPALPGFDFERELLRDYFAQRHGRENAFDYTYTYPAMARVVQSAGRVIRSPTDRGLIVLMDRRFTQASYRKSMPADWTDGEENLISGEILKDVRQFWRQDEPTDDEETPPL